MTRSLLAALLLTTACDPAVAPSDDDVVARIDVSGLGALSGVAVQPDTGERLVLAGDRLHLIEGNGTITALPFQPDALGFTDVTALGGGMVALSARSDGFLFDTVTGSLQQHFCYEPGDVIWEDEFQITYGLAYDTDRDLILAQPQTAAESDPDTPINAFVSSYDATTGQDLEWFGMPSAEYRAGGLVVTEPDTLWLGVGARLDRFGFGTSDPQRFARLGPLGIGDISGLAVDADAGTLLVADATDGEVVEVRLAALR